MDDEKEFGDFTNTEKKEKTILQLDLDWEEEKHLLDAVKNYLHEIDKKKEELVALYEKLYELDKTFLQVDSKFYL